MALLLGCANQGYGECHDESPCITAESLVSASSAPVARGEVARVNLALPTSRQLVVGIAGPPPLMSEPLRVLVGGRALTRSATHASAGAWSYEYQLVEELAPGTVVSIELSPSMGAAGDTWRLTAYATVRRERCTHCAL